MNPRLATVNDYIEKWAKERPDHVAMIQHEDNKSLTYKKFYSLIDFFALKLLDMGIQKGDRVATQLVLVPEHLMLMYACFKIGAIIAPLDLRLTETEVVRDINKIEPKAFFFLGNTPVKDFRKVGEAVQKGCSSVEHLVQFTPDPKAGDIIDKAVSITALMDKKRLLWLIIFTLSKFCDFSRRSKSIQSLNQPLFTVYVVDKISKGKHIPLGEPAYL